MHFLPKKNYSTMVTSEQFNFHVQFCQGFQNPLLNLFKKKKFEGGHVAS